MLSIITVQIPPASVPDSVTLTRFGRCPVLIDSVTVTANGHCPAFSDCVTLALGRVVRVSVRRSYHLGRGVRVSVIVLAHWARVSVIVLAHWLRAAARRYP